jgi:hypothetical protein
VSLDFAKLYKAAIAFYSSLDIIIYGTEVKKYKDVTKQFKNLTSDGCVGFVTPKFIQLIDIAHSAQSEQSEQSAQVTWFEVNRMAMNRHITFRENDTMIGYFESSDNFSKFKLRRPMQIIREAIKHNVEERKSKHEGPTTRPIMGDTRLIERGLVCDTKSKTELLHLIAALGVSTSRLSEDDMRVKRLCEIIKARMIELEQIERGRKSSKKYIYCWADDIPNLTYHVR